MSSLYFIAFVFPFLFMFHEFEEIIYLPKWLEINKRNIIEKIPPFMRRYLKDTTISFEKFAFAVFLEFCFVYTILIIIVVYQSAFVLSVLILAFLIHLLIHIIQSVLIRKRIPSLVSSVFLVPICTICLTELITTYYLLEFLLEMILCALGTLILTFVCIAIYFRKA